LVSPIKKAGRDYRSAFQVSGGIHAAPAIRLRILIGQNLNTNRLRGI